MSSMPVYQQQTIPAQVYQNAVSSNEGSHSHGSVGPVLAVLSVITILGVLACVAGRICAGRLFSANSKYDCVGWMERRCAACIDGDVEQGHDKNIPVGVPNPPPPAEKADADAKPPEGTPAPAA